MLLKARNVLAVVTLCAFAPGCSTYRPAALSKIDQADSVAAPVEEVKTGQNARVTLVSGEVIAGEVTAVTPDAITVGRLGNYGMKENSIGAREIARLEVEQSSKAADIVAFSAVGVLIVGTIFFAALADGLEEGLGGSD